MGESCTVARANRKRGKVRIVEKIRILFPGHAHVFPFLALFHKQKLFTPLTKEEISGEHLWKRITEEKNFKKYPFWPGVK